MNAHMSVSYVGNTSHEDHEKENLTIMRKFNRANTQPNSPKAPNYGHELEYCKNSSFSKVLVKSFRDV